ncbi:phage head morphogenesis protein [Lactiplantibacillus modestisalitolerans]|uniref:Phage head morphogenesis protein n=1 Tax=Lactiplantibacillus modestisalitolerans TaxID=1457219 RepID=A0ABV5WVC0_9LACO|nr:phage head morphogenesis protein [Lactiplantibacillus modestisalitolerans]
MAKTNQQRAKEQADQIDRQTKHDGRISKEVAATLALFLSFWYAFVEGNGDYDHASDSQLANQQLKQQVDQDARQAGVKTKPASTNDDLLQYAGYVYASILAFKLVDHVGGKLSEIVVRTAKNVQNMYGGGSGGGNYGDIVDKLMDGAKWSDRIWANQDQLRADLTAEMKRALLTHDNPVTQTSKLRKKFKVADYQSRRILRTESSRVMNAVTLQKISDEGYKHVVWVANSGACRACASHEGEIRTLKQADGVIPFHPNCLCTWAAVD